MNAKLITVIAFIGILSSCHFKSPDRSNSAEMFNEKYRPQYHFSPPTNWMNDPNGMVYHDGEYHLFYQHYPDGNKWGPMHWGHAVSSDMIHWEHLPIALYPDSLGYIFSGSAVIDVNNTTGFGSKEKPAMVAIYTYHDAKAEREGKVDFQTQGIALSLDNGRTWTKYKGNPVLNNPGIRDFRDPKVSWNEKLNKWVMILAVKDHVTIYSSPDLKNWAFESEFGNDIGAHGGVWECPDLFPLTDDSGSTHWVMLVSINPGGPQGGSATQYFVGQFDGSEFIPYDTITRWVDYGADNYAGVTWSNIPESDGRRLFLGWMSNWQYANEVPTTEWRSAMTIPRELKLQFIDKEPALISTPVDELKKLESTPVKFSETINLKNSLFKLDLKPTELPFELHFSNDLNDELIISFTRENVKVNRANSGKTGFSDLFPATHFMDMKGKPMNNIQVYSDRSSLELFINGGQLVMSELVFPNSPYNKLWITNKNVESEITYLKPIW
ncbi:MAG: glycoside hydrolase family 32 protein [Marinoscillum sp.]